MDDGYEYTQEKICSKKNHFGSSKITISCLLRQYAYD